MKFTIQRDELARALARAATPITRKLALPILTHVLVRTTDDGVEFTGTDLDVTVTTRAPANVLKSGTIALPVDRAAQMVALLPPGPVTIAEDKKAVVLTSGSHRSRLSAFSADEFPSRQQAQGEVVSIPVALVRALAQRVAFCCVEHESRPVYLGVSCVSRDSGATFVASNGNTLVTELATDFPVTFRNVLPARALQIAAKLLNTDDDVEFTSDNDRACFTQGGTSVEVRMVEGEHPDVTRFFALEFPNVLTVDLVAFEVVLKRLAVVLDEEQSSATFDFSPGRLQKAVASATDRGRVTEELVGGFEGSPLRIALNVRQLITVASVLGKAGAEIVTIHFGSGPEKPFLIQATGEMLPRLISMPMRALMIEEVLAEEVA